MCVIIKYCNYCHCVLFGKYDEDLETGVPLAPPPDRITGEYFSVVVTLGVTLACHCNLTGGSDARYLGSSNGGCGLFSLSLLSCTVGGGTNDKIIFHTIVTLKFGSPWVMGGVSFAVLLLAAFACCAASGDGMGTAPPTNPARLNITYVNLNTNLFYM